MSHEKRQKARTYDERFDGFSCLEQLEWSEYEALDSLIESADKGKGLAEETLNEMIELRFDGDPDYGGWRGVLADWRGGEE